MVYWSSMRRTLPLAPGAAPSAGAKSAARVPPSAAGKRIQTGLSLFSPVEAARRLYAQVFRVGGDVRRHARWLGLVAALVRDPGCGLLRFRREPSFWEALLHQGKAA